jgi:hypothetical protein
MAGERGETTPGVGTVIYTGSCRRDTTPVVVGRAAGSRQHECICPNSGACDLENVTVREATTREGAADSRSSSQRG